MGSVDGECGTENGGSSFGIRVLEQHSHFSVTLYPSPIPTWKSGTMGSAAEGLTLLWNARKCLELPGITWE